MFLNIGKSDDIDKSFKYVVLRINGLFGDALHGACKLQWVLNNFPPEYKWIMIHTYGSEERSRKCYDLFSYWFDIGKMKYWFHHPDGGSYPVGNRFSNFMKKINTPMDRLIDLFVCQKKPSLITQPMLGIEIPEKKNLKKAVIFRKSAWHGHFPRRNRPYKEWEQIEGKLMSLGYDVHLFGLDDEMPITPGVIDHRRNYEIKDILKNTADASICITTTTFLYLWTQFVCPTFVITEGGDVHGLTQFWKLHENMRLVNIDRSNFLMELIKNLEEYSGARTSDVKSIIKNKNKAFVIL